MKRFCSVIIVTALLTSVFSCSATNSKTDEVHIRVENVSSRDMDDIELGFLRSTEEFGRLKAGEAGAYRVVSEAYSIARVSTVVEGKLLGLQPIDFEGEKPLEAGFYTYRLSIHGDNSGGIFSLNFELKKD